jgi:hypothetical protein
VKKNLRIKSAVLVLLAICLPVGIYFYNTTYKHRVICLNPYEVKDSSSGKDPVRICDNVLYRGTTKIVGKSEFPDLFQFRLNKDSKPEQVKQYVRVFEKERQEYVSMKSVIDYGSWNDSAIGIYRKEEDKYMLVFKKAFDDHQGRWVNIEFGEDTTSRDSFFYISSQGGGISISGDIGYLGCFGRCRLLWWDYYNWDLKNKTFVLANNKYPENFKSLLDNYKEWDKTTCLDEANVSASISSLYRDRKNKEKFCSDDVRVPYTDSGQAAMLLKGIKAIERILKGENIPMSQVKNMTLD